MEANTTPPASNRLSSISGAVTRTLSYQPSGQVFGDVRPGASSWSYTIDKAGRMASAALNGSTRAGFAYDGNEQRIVKTRTLTGAVTHYIYDADGQLIAEMDGTTGAPIREYVWLGALPVGYVDRLGQRLCARAGGTPALPGSNYYVPGNAGVSPAFAARRNHFPRPVLSA